MALIGYTYDIRSHVKLERSQSLFGLDTIAWITTPTLENYTAHVEDIDLVAFQSWCVKDSN